MPNTAEAEEQQQNGEAAQVEETKPPDPSRPSPVKSKGSDPFLDVDCENEDGYTLTLDDDDIETAASTPMTARSRSPKGTGKAKAKALPAALGHPKQSKKANRQCRGCKKWFGGEGMSLAKAFCHVCNRGMDNIRYASDKQGKMDWYQRMRADPNKCEQALKEYGRRFPDQAGVAIGSGQKRPKTATEVTIQILEYLIVATKVLRETEGEMMWQKEYIEFAQTKKGGALSDDEARVLWTKWCQEISSDPNTKLIHDQDGPVVSPLRIWVKTRDRVVYQDSVEKQKVMKLAEKEQKKPDQVAIDAMGKRLFTDHDKIGRGSSAVDLNQMAQQMQRNSHGEPGAGAFEGRGMDIPDVEELAGDEEESEEGDDADGGEEGAAPEDGQDEPGDGAAPEEPPAKKKRTNNTKQPEHKVESMITRYVRNVDFEVTKISAAVQVVFSGAEKDVASASTPTIMSKVVGELNILKNRVKALQLVFQGPDEELRQFISSFQRRPGGGDSALSSGALVAARKETRESEMGRAPPCAKYKDLITLGELTSSVQQFWALSTKTEMDQLKKDIAAKRKPINDLMASVKQAQMDLTKAIKTRKDQAATAEAAANQTNTKGKGKGKSAASAPVPPVQNLIAMGLAKGREMLTVKEGEGQTVDKAEFNPATPFVIACSEETVASFHTDVFALPMQEFYYACDKSSQVRSATSFPESSELSIKTLQLFAKFLPASEVITVENIEVGAGEGADQLRPFFLPTAYKITESYCASANMKGEVATIWYNLAGQREVLAIPSAPAVDFYVGATEEKARPKDPMKFKQAVRGHIAKLTEDFWVDMYIYHTYIYYFRHEFIFIIIIYTVIYIYIRCR